MVTPKPPALSSPRLLSCTNIPVQIPVPEPQAQSTPSPWCFFLSALHPEQGHPAPPRRSLRPAAPGPGESTNCPRSPDKRSGTGSGRGCWSYLFTEGAGGGRLVRVARSSVKRVSTAFSSFAARPIPLIELILWLGRDFSQLNTFFVLLNFFFFFFQKVEFLLFKHLWFGGCPELL